jgi:hypothetical protein
LLSREQTRKGKSNLLQEGGGEPSLATDGGFRMDFMPQQIFIREIERQCTFALMAYEDLQQARSDYNHPSPKPPAPDSTDAAHVQATMA